MSQLRKSSSAASHANKINEIKYLRGQQLTALLSLIPSDICDGQAALDDVRNWIVSTLLELDARLLSGGFCHRSALLTIVSVMSRESLARRHRTRDRHVSAIDFLG